MSIHAHSKYLLHFHSPATAREVIAWQTGGFDRLLHDDGPDACREALDFAARYTDGVDQVSGHLTTPVGSWASWGRLQRRTALSKWLGVGNALHQYIGAILAPCVLPQETLTEIENHMSVWTVDGGCSCVVCRGERDDVTRTAANCLFKGTSDRSWALLASTASIIDAITLDDSYPMHQIYKCWQSAKARAHKERERKHKDRQDSHEILKAAGLMR